MQQASDAEPPPAGDTAPTEDPGPEAPAGVELLTELRLQRHAAPLENTVVLTCHDGEARLSRRLAEALSSVLRAALAQETGTIFLLKDHSAATVEYALDFCCYDDAKKVHSAAPFLLPCCAGCQGMQQVHARLASSTPPTSVRPHAQISTENVMALLSFADDICLEYLREACSSFLITYLDVSTAAQLEDIALNFNTPELLAAARAITTAESPIMADVIAQELNLQRVWKRTEKSYLEAKDRMEHLKDIRWTIEKLQAQELERLFRKKSQAKSTVLEDGYPHAAGRVLCVEPNANNTDGWFWDHGFTPWPVSDDEDAPPAAKRTKIDRDGGIKQRQPFKPTSRPRKVYKSIMEAYAAAAPGDVIKLPAGRHVVTTLDQQGERRWDNVCRKSVQIVADDGLASDKVLVGILQFNRAVTDKESAIAIMRADIRIAGVTLVCAGENLRTGFLGVSQEGRLWLEDCSIRLSSSHCGRCMGERPRDDDGNDVGGAVAGNGEQQHADCGPGGRRQNALRQGRGGRATRKAEFAHGVAVGPGAGCCIRDCVIDGAGCAGVEISLSAAVVLIESSTITGCSSGSTRMTAMGAWNLAGECGAVEIEAWKQQDAVYSDTTGRPSVQVWLRNCQLINNFGPGVSLRSDGDISFATAWAARISLDDCTISGNNKDPRVSTVVIAEDNPVVWNQTERGARYTSVWGTALSAEDNYWQVEQRPPWF
jgi:hypothetical protein